MYTILAAMLLEFANVLDHVDGEIARYRKSASLNGWYADDLTHHILKPIVLIGLTFNVYSQYNNILVFLPGLMSVLFSANFGDISKSGIFLSKLQQGSIKSSAGNLSPSKKRDAISDTSRNTSTSRTNNQSVSILFKIHNILLSFKIWRIKLTVNPLVHLITMSVIFDFFAYKYIGFRLMDVVLLVYGLVIPIAKASGLIASVISKRIEKEYVDFIDSFEHNK